MVYEDCTNKNCKRPYDSLIPCNCSLKHTNKSYFRRFIIYIQNLFS